MLNIEEIDFLIISTLKEEHKAVLRHFDVVEDCGLDDAVYVYLDNKKRKNRGVALVLADIGRVHAAISTTKAFMKWKPIVTILVGTAGGFEKQRVAIGDVVVATEIIDFEYQKLTDNGEIVRLRSFHGSQQLLSLSKKIVSNNEDILSKVHFGAILSGEKVIASESAVNMLNGWCRNAIGVEMEGVGVAIALQESKTKFLMIRGISDLANENKTDEHQIEASNVAAKFSLNLLKVYFNHISYSER